MHMHSTSIVLTRCAPGMQELQTKEIKNARLAMVAFVGFIVAAQATGQVMDTPTSCSLVVCQCITTNKCPVVCSLLTGPWYAAAIALHAVTPPCQWRCQVVS